MKRSKKESSALNAAYVVCMAMKNNCGNVIAGAMKDESDIHTDIEMLKYCVEFENLYLSIINEIKS